MNGNIHLEMLDSDMRNHGIFKCNFVNQIIDSRDSIAKEMCATTGISNISDIRRDDLNKRNITKEKLCQWVETLSCLVDSFCVPVLKLASELSSEVSQFKNEKIEDSKKIIDLQEKLLVSQEADMKKIVDLQEKLIDRKEGDIGTVTSLVQSEMKSYSSLFQNTCKTAFAPSKIKAVVKRVTEEEDRSRNLILYGMEENEYEDNEMLGNGVTSVFQHLNEKPAILSCHRVGTDKSNSRPIKITLYSSDMVRQILRKTTLLKEVSGYDELYLCPDRTYSERVAHRKLVETLKKTREEVPGKVHFIRNNSIVTREKRAEE